MKHLLLIALIIMTSTAFAGGKTCKVYLNDHIGHEEKEAGITYYDYVDVLAAHGYEATTIKEEADIHLTMGVGYIQRCYSGMNDFDILLDDILTADATVWISYKNKTNGKRIHVDKYIYRNITRKKTLRKLNKLMKKLPKCN